MKSRHLLNRNQVAIMLRKKQKGIFMNLFYIFLSFAICSTCLAEQGFKKTIEIAPGTIKTVVVETSVPMTFNAEFKNMEYLESKKCGNCLHIQSITAASKNTAASNHGVGFLSISPKEGKISVDVYHDYTTSKIIEVTSTPYQRK
jgi:hypothetical protein